jgi:prephenate dehydratase
MTASRRIGYLGSRPVTFSHEASLQLGPGHQRIGFHTHAEIYDAVREGEVDLGVLAVENQLAGVVDETLHAVVQPILPASGALSDSHTLVRIVRELSVPVDLWLVNQSGRLQDIRCIKTHPIPMRQCKETLARLRREHPFIQETCASTDAAAEEAALHPEIAAITGRAALEGYPVLRSICQVDDPVPGASYRNVTRFWVIERHPEGGVSIHADDLAAESQTHKICVLFNLRRDAPGGLARSLSVFAEEAINLAIIYPLPRRDRSWEYTFVLEFETPPDSAHQAARALQRLRAVADAIVLGIYPKSSAAAG